MLYSKLLLPFPCNMCDIKIFFHRVKTCSETLQIWALFLFPFSTISLLGREGSFDGSGYVAETERTPSHFSFSSRGPFLPTTPLPLPPPVAPFIGGLSPRATYSFIVAPFPPPSSRVFFRLFLLLLFLFCFHFLFFPPSLVRLITLRRDFPPTRKGKEEEEEEEREGIILGALRAITQRTDGRKRRRRRRSERTGGREARLWSEGFGEGRG